MMRARFMAIAVLTVAVIGMMVMGTAVSAQADPVSATFEVKSKAKEWCEGNPKFFENVTVKIDPINPANNVTTTFTRNADGVGDDTDISITFGNTGSADFDVITLKGRAFPANAAASKLQFAASGVSSVSDDHFVTVRGLASLDTLGNVTKLTGTIVYEITGTYTIKTPLPPHQSSEVGCFASGTFVTGKKL